jgi:phosphoribosylformylglycinamidine synthase subunit PurL
MSVLSSAPFSAAEIASEGIKPEEYEEIVRRLGRHPNKAELGMFGVMWSEHCCYKNSRPLLKQFPTEGDRVLVGPGENAGVVDLGDGLQLAFKIESHNHPSAVEPFQGAATGVGGILRDIFTMGARPIALLNSLRFGTLDDARTRRIVNGVVAGISHYGNCLIGSETLIWRDQNGVHFDTIGNFVESRLPAHLDTYKLSDDEAVETLSIDPDTHQSCWQRVRRIFKRQAQQLLTIKTAMGRSLTVTPDHPTLVRSGDNWDVYPAQNLNVGDALPIATAFPLVEQNSTALDFIALAEREPALASGTFVTLPEEWQPTELVRTALRLVEPNIQKRHRYLDRGRFPLAHFLRLESVLGASRSDLRLFRKGKANHINALIQPNESFARLIGYYLAEGCVSQNGNTFKIILTFGLHEQAYVEDVAEAFEALGLRACIEKRETTIAIYATSWMLGYAFKHIWRCGADARTKSIPSFVFQWSSELQREVLKGLLRGDGSLTTICHGNHAKISFGTISRRLSEQVLMLLQAQGAVPSIHCRASQVGTIGGRSHVTSPLWQLGVSNLRGLHSLVDVFSEGRNQKLAVALSRYTSPQYSYPRFKPHSDDVATVKIRSIESQTLDRACDVYDIEVDETHLFVTSSGIVTHNCVGVPTVGGEVYFDRAYSGNPLVNVMALGLMETTEIVKSGAKGLGNPVLYVGSTTGRDGMGGASFASAELSEESIDDRPAVQVGDPFLEKSLIEACLEAFKTGAVVAAQDMGAAGISCSTSEMAAKGGVGIELDLDLIPVREAGMVPYEYLLSESQERMLFVSEKGREQELIDIFEKWGLHAVVAGKVIEEEIVRILFQGAIAAEIPATALADNTPIYHRELISEPPEYAQKAWAWTDDNLPNCDEKGISGQSWNEVVAKLLNAPTIASKRWVYRQYDHQVQNNTVLLPGGADAAVVRVRPLADSQSSSVTPDPAILNKGVAATVDCNPRYVYLHPYEGAKAAVAEAARNLSCVGAEPIAITDNLNFGSPEKPIGYWQLSEACRGLSEACREFSTPVTGGNVSLYNETLDSEGKPEPIYPTPVVGMVGFIPDLDRIVGQSWKQSGDVIYLLGVPLSDSSLNLGASEYLATVHQTIAGKPPIVDFDLERKVQSVVRSHIRSGLIQSAHDCSEGGTAIALSECCFGHQLGADIQISEISTRIDQALFAEGGARIIVSIKPESITEWQASLTSELGDHWQKIGTVGGESLKISIAQKSIIDATIAELYAGWSSAIEKGLTE